MVALSADERDHSMVAKRVVLLAGCSAVLSGRKDVVKVAMKDAATVGLTVDGTDATTA